MSHHTYNLDDAVKKESRAPIDASWSPRRKRAVMTGCIVVAAGAVGAGAWAALANAAPGLPSSANEALAVINSDKFNRLDSERKEQYLAETARLMREVPEEQRREFFRDPKNREAFGKLMEERFDDIAKKFARGEEIANPFPGGPPRGQRPEGEQPRTPPTQEERDKRMEEMRQKANERMAQQLKSGNPQSSGLRGEMMKRGGAMGGRGGMGGGPRGGGGGGGGGGGARGGGGGKGG